MSDLLRGWLRHRHPHSSLSSFTTGALLSSPTWKTSRGHKESSLSHFKLENYDWRRPMMRRELVEIVIIVDEKSAFRKVHQVGLLNQSLTVRQHPRWIIRSNIMCWAPTYYLRSIWIWQQTGCCNFIINQHPWFQSQKRAEKEQRKLVKRGKWQLPDWLSLAPASSAFSPHVPPAPRPFHHVTRHPSPDTHSIQATSKSPKSRHPPTPQQQHSKKTATPPYPPYSNLPLQLHINPPTDRLDTIRLPS